MMTTSHTERAAVNRQLITCLKELASLAQRSADVFHELGNSVTAIDSTLSRVSVRTAELDRKIEEWKASPDGQAPSGLDITLASPPRSPLATISESPSPPSRRAKAPALFLFSPSSRPLQERERYASVRPLTAPVPVCEPVVSSSPQEMKRSHNPSAESIFSFTDKSSSCGGSSRRSSWRESFRLPSKRRRRLGLSSAASTPTGAERPRSVDFSHRHTVAFIDSPAPPSDLESPTEGELERRHHLLANGGVRRQYARSTGEVPDVLTNHQTALDDHVISALVERTLHLSGHLDHGLHRPQSSHFSTTSAGPPAGPSERSQSCNGLLEQDEGPSPRKHYPSGNLPCQAPMPPPRQGSLMRASSMPMSPEMVVGQDGSVLAAAIDTPKLKRSMSISQRARALFRPASTRRSRSRSKEGHLSETPHEFMVPPDMPVHHQGNISRCVSGSTDEVQRRRKSRGRSKSPISWLLSRINPPGGQQPPAQQTRAVSCVDAMMPVEADHSVFESPAPSRSVTNLFRRRSRSRETRKVDGGRLASGSRSPATFHRFRADSDDVDFFVRRHIIDFPSHDADDFHVHFSRLASLRMRREALWNGPGVGPEPYVPLSHVRHFMQSGRDIMTRRGRHRHSRRQTDRYSADATPSTPGLPSTPTASPAIRPTSLAVRQQTNLRHVTNSGVAGVGSLAEQLDKLSSQFSNAVSLRRGYKGSGSRSSSGHWSVSTSSLHPKRSSYMSTAGQPTSPLSAVSSGLPGHSLVRSVSKDSALDSSSPCERPASDLVNSRSVEVQTDRSARTPRNTDCGLPFSEDDVFCRSSAETLSSVPPAPPPRSASLKRSGMTECDNALYQARSFSGSGEGFTITQRSRPTTPGRSAERGQPLPVTMPYRSGTLPRNLKARLKGGSDTLKRLENCYRSPEDQHDSDSDSDYTAEHRVSSSGSEGPIDVVVDPAPSLPVKMMDKSQSGELVAPIAMKIVAPIQDPTGGPTLLQHPHQLRSLSSNSHLSSFSGDSDTGSSCSGPNPYQRLYSLSTQRGRPETPRKYSRNRRLVQEPSV